MTTRCRDIVKIAVDVRTQLKKEFPEFKFSVTIKKYSGGRSLSIDLMSGPQEVVTHYKTSRARPEGEWVAEFPNCTREHQINHYILQRYPDGDDCCNPVDRYITNGVRLTKDAWRMLNRVVEIAQGDNWDNSDSMTDYFDVNYFFHLSIGKWDKPYAIKDGKARQ